MIKGRIFNLRVGQIDKENVQFLQERGFNVSALVRRWLQTKVDKVRKEAADEIE